MPVTKLGKKVTVRQRPNSALEVSQQIAMLAGSVTAVRGSLMGSSLTDQSVSTTGYRRLEIRQDFIYEK